MSLIENYKSSIVSLKNKIKLDWFLIFMKLIFRFNPFLIHLTLDIPISIKQRDWRLGKPPSLMPKQETITTIVRN